MSAFFFSICSVIALLTVPPLTPEQEAMLEATSPVKQSLEEAGFYALLENTAWWKPGDESGAVVPNYDALYETPDEHRGELFLIEGIFPGTPEMTWPDGQTKKTLRVPPTSRAGPWNERLQRWPIIVKKPDGSGDVVVVYLTDPPQQRPRPGDRIRTVGRFYKVWQDRNVAGEQQDFLVFVGRSARFVDGGDGATRSGIPDGGGMGEHIYSIIGLLVLVLAAGYYVLRKSVANKPSPAQVRRQARVEARQRPEQSDEGQSEEEDAGPPLPEDPVEALQELEKRHEEKE